MKTKLDELHKIYDKNHFESKNFLLLLQQNYSTVGTLKKLRLLQKFIPILLLSATLLQPLQNFWVKFSFELNRSYIAKNLCENRFKPELKCGGQCYLMKKLAEKQKQQKENTSERIEVFVATPFSQEKPEFCFENHFILPSNHYNSTFLSFTFQECLLSTFHPPCV